MPCHRCSSGAFEVIGSRERKVRKNAGQIECYITRRLRCLVCRKIHHELPNFMIPYKRYDARTIEEGIRPSEPLVLPLLKLNIELPNIQESDFNYLSQD
ncbi:DUF6431 domain-containing protein [Sporosarcina beigongshangi]|uniref:DUF6431 domain-containing protein n=1 Tax=Sporosarcina beigongshangi TaxID=2782538 RepID=UPI002ACD9B00|nr:DUF6431 domain-containing protein [Sporosarcina beigongshangi]